MNNRPVRPLFRARLYLPRGTSLRQTWRLVRAVLRLRRMAERIGADATVRLLERAAADHPDVTVKVVREGD
jgi:hypothetical protein